jgi:hypothetical protein
MRGNSQFIAQRGPNIEAELDWTIDAGVDEQLVAQRGPSIDWIGILKPVLKSNLSVSLFKPLVQGPKAL